MNHENTFRPDESYARELDDQDAMAGFRERFLLQPDRIYLDGNSLGLQSRDSRSAVERVLDDWNRLAIDGWTQGRSPWFHISEKLGDTCAALVGAGPGEVVASGTTTVNIHALAATFFQPKGKKKKILADSLNFPTDLYALQGQLKIRGLDPGKNLILADSDDGRTLDEEKIIELMSDEVALVFLPSVLYRSGQLLNMQQLTRAAHQRGIAIGFDLSHSAGVVPHRLSEWGVDFALWCSYKYLNGGPGSTAFLYLNRRHFDKEPMLPGWFGYVKEKQFDMLTRFESACNAGGWQISSPGVLGAAAVEGALKVIEEAGINNIRKKSLQMTRYLLQLLDYYLRESPYLFSPGTPAESHRRGGHVALERYENAWPICQALKARGIIPDFRSPNTIRLAPVALYNSFHDIWFAVQNLREIIDLGEYWLFPGDRPEIT